MKKILSLVKDTEGQAIVESALVIFFVLIPLILGMIEFGWIFNRQLTLTNIAREGARAAVVCTDVDDAYGKVIGVIASSGFSGVTPNETQFRASWNSGNAEVSLTAKIKPLVGLYVSTDEDGNFQLTVKSIMRKEN